MTDRFDPSLSWELMARNNAPDVFILVEYLRKVLSTKVHEISLKLAYFCLFVGAGRGRNLPACDAGRQPLRTTSAAFVV